MMKAEALKHPSFSAELRIARCEPTSGVSVDAERAVMQLDKMRRILTGAAQKISDTPNRVAKSETIEGRLAEKLASLKRIAASVGMYLDPDWRTRLFSKLDQLLDVEEWDEDFAMPSEASFSTFLRLVIYLHPTKRPGLGLSAKGHILASWTREQDRIVIECLPDDEVRWVLSHSLTGHMETAAGKTKIYRIPDVIVPYEPDALFSDGHKLLV
jgi:hypothetical protein